MVKTTRNSQQKDRILLIQTIYDKSLFCLFSMQRSDDLTQIFDRIHNGLNVGRYKLYTLLEIIDNLQFGNEFKKISMSRAQIKKIGFSCINIVNNRFSKISGPNNSYIHMCICS